MPVPVMIPRILAQRKPPHGQPCNHCGICCIATLCPLGKHVFRRQMGPCPALAYDDDLHASCGLVTDPMRFAPERTAAKGDDTMSAAASLIIGASTGCDARINGEPRDTSFDQKLRILDRLNKDAVAQSKLTWGM